RIERNIVISEGFVDLTGNDDSDFEDENKDTGEASGDGNSSREEDENDVPALSKQQIQQLIASRKRNCHMFRCENCKNEFDIENNGKKDCWYHPGVKEVYDGDDFWADHDDDAMGFQSFMKTTQTLLMGSSGIVVRNWEVRRAARILDIKLWKRGVARGPDTEI
ncbi:hypothetical protein DSL72_001632, partial [Monilinia vaccinii-corymbosi]